MSVNSHLAHAAAPRKTPMQQRSQRTVVTIVDAAARIFAERGYTGTTTNHVAEAAGVSIGSLYQYYPNKDSLLVALEERHLVHVQQSLAQIAQEWREQQPDPAEWARSLVDVLIGANDSPVHVLIYDNAPPLPRINELTGGVVDALVKETRSQLRRWGHREGTEMRARILVIATLRLVHDVAIRAPRGRIRTRARNEITRMVEAVIAGDSPPAHRQ